MTRREIQAEENQEQEEIVDATQPPGQGAAEEGERRKFHAALLSLGSGSSQMTLEAMRKHFAQVDDIDIKQLEVNISGKDAQVLYKGQPLGHYDCIYAKGSFRYAPLLSSVTNILADRTYMPIHASAFTIVHDKLLTHLALQRHNIPMPRTYIAATPAAAKRIMQRMNFPIIMKFPQGTQGKGVVFAESYSSSSSILDALTALRQPFILQEYIETGGEDIRAFVVGDRVVAAMKRKADPDEKRSNLHAGGKAEPIILDGATEQIAIKAAKAVKAEICGVDILQSVRGTMVIEANVSPGIQGLTEATGIAVADKIATYLRRQTELRSKSADERKKERILQSLNGKHQTMMVSLDLRANRVLLPELLTKQCKFTDDQLYEIKSGEGFLEIRRMNIS